MKKPFILVTNDDGITAPGIRHLVNTARQLGEVLVVAPDSPQSGQGHAITLNQPLRLRPSSVFAEWNIPAYECSGTPVDCVKLAKNILAKERNIDLCVSGINHGSNASINILYSGTMSAAMEASIEGIPSVGFSLMDFSWDADFDASAPYVRRVMEYILRNGLQGTRLLNVNIPNLPAERLRGLRVCRQAEGHWTEEFQEGKDPAGRPYYWLTGSFICRDNGTDTDIWALQNGYISVVPSMHDLTAHGALASLQTLSNF